jgi:hypothetical protein
VLRGHAVECLWVQDAIAYLLEEEKVHRLRDDCVAREAFMVPIRFNTGTRIDATFPSRAEAISFPRGLG